MAVGPKEETDKKNIPDPNARIYAYIKGEVEVGSSKVVTSQLPVVNKIALCCLTLELRILFKLLCLLIA